MRFRSLLVLLVTGAAVLAPGAAAGSESITACAGPDNTASSCSPTVTTSSGVYFSVTAGGGNRDYASVSVECTGPGGGVVYSTILNVAVPPKGAGVSAVVYPPASTCVASLLKQMAIGRARVLATTSFVVA